MVQIGLKCETSIQLAFGLRFKCEIHMLGTETDPALASVGAPDHPRGEFTSSPCAGSDGATVRPGHQSGLEAQRVGDLQPIAIVFHPPQDCELLRREMSDSSHHDILFQYRQVTSYKRFVTARLP